MENFRAMKERSQIDEMRAVIRGDLERSRARQQSSPVAQPTSEPEVDEQEIEEPRPGIFGSLFKRR